ncbi:CAAX amino terminal protease family protein [Wolffia australiana]
MLSTLYIESPPSQLKSLGRRKPSSPVRNLGFCSSFSALNWDFGPCSSSLVLKRDNSEARFPIFCQNKENRDGFSSNSFDEDQPSTGFSIIPSDVPWDSGRVWSIMGGYFFCLHIPLSFGGLPAISEMLNHPTLDPQTETYALVLLQTLELIGALTLLHYSAKEKYNISSFFLDHHHQGRSWIKASALGLGFLIAVVFLTSLLADRLFGSKAVNNQDLKEILDNFPQSEVGFFLIYCLITPVLEEGVYRGFLLRSLAVTRGWRWAVFISAVVFSSAHLSLENSPQLFFIGCVLGSAYCWSGNLAASFVIHSLYNALILMAHLS